MDFNLNFNYSWTYNDFVHHAKTFKSSYKELLASFYLVHPKLANEFARKTKNNIYSLSFELWKRDKCWEYLNNDQKLSHLRAFMR